jgi:hypothetical protein
MKESKLQDKNKAIFKRASKRMLHPNCRKIDQMQRSMKHNIRTEEIDKKNSQLRSNVGIRFSWFHSQLPRVAGTNVLSEDDQHALVLTFINRNDAEAEASKKQRNPQRGHIKALAAVKQAETDAYCSSKGLQVPLMTTQDGVASLMEWNLEDESVLRVEDVQLTQPHQADERKRLAALAVVVAARASADLTEVREARDIGRGRVTVAEKKEIAASKTTKVKRAVAAGKVSVKAAGKVTAAAGHERRLYQRQKDAATRRHSSLAMSRGLM